MKKLVVFIFATILCVAAGVIPRESALNLSGAKKVTFIVDAQIAADEKLDFIQSGGDAIIDVGCENIKEKYKKYTPKSVIFEYDRTQREYVENFLSLNFTVLQNLDNMQIVYGYTSKFDRSELIDGKKINVMIVQKEDRLLVGFPIIMTGF